METETRLYEMEYLIKGDLGEEEALEKAEIFRKEIEKEDGLIIQENKPKKKNLGYSIKKYDIAYYGSVKFTIPAENIATLKKNLEKSDLLRLLLNKMKHEREISKYSIKRRPIRQSAKKEYPLIEGAAKELVPPPAPSAPTESRSEPSSPASLGGPLQVEEIDKKLEEILGQ